MTTLQFQGAGNGGDWSGVKAFNGFRGFTICDMTLRFGTVANPDPGGQMHLLQAVNSTSATQSTRDFVAYNLGFGQCIGAGFRVLGENGANFLVENVSIHHCIFRSEGIGAELLGDSAWVFERGGFALLYARGEEYCHGLRRNDRRN